MKNKLFLPVMAMVLAIGMSFATERSTADPDQDYYLVGNIMVPIDEVDCGEGTAVCRIQFEENGTIHTIYDAEDSDLDSPKLGSGGVIELWR